MLLCKIGASTTRDFEQTPSKSQREPIEGFSFRIAIRRAARNQLETGRLCPFSIHVPFVVRLEWIIDLAEPSDPRDPRDSSDIELLSDRSRTIRPLDSIAAHPSYALVSLRALSLPSACRFVLYSSDSGYRVFICAPERGVARSSHGIDSFAIVPRNHVHRQFAYRELTRLLDKRTTQLIAETLSADGKAQMNSHEVPADWQNFQFKSKQTLTLLHARGKEIPTRRDA